ncbi:ArsR/SmtB family transcription factor [Streptomyces griseorubiginosus]|uniref:ArsR/SmtB family transcription factor n=1 Tax=Streptomyces griseorubiginosus TaxID=67304 RepID=UPI0036C04289
MALTLRLGNDDLRRSRFAVSPLCQTHEALRMLRRSARHGYHRDWLRRVAPAVAGLDLSSLWLFIPPAGGYTPDFLGPPPEEPCPRFEDELARVRATDPCLAREEMARSLACTPGLAESPRGRAALDDPAGTVRRLADLTEQAWQALVAPDWARHRAVLEADIAHRSRQVADAGLDALFADLHPDVDWAEGSLTLPVRGDMRDAQLADGRGVLLMPSVFVWPDVVSGFARPWQPTVIYPARGMRALDSAEPPRPPEALARLLGRQRAAVLAGLNDPASTTALALRHGLAPSTVSAHLAVLREAGLLASRRQGLHVLYGRTPLGDSVVSGA